ncbi:antitoxin Xre-like helix-turn-helix domain-containing protein [Aquisalimonas sp. 2447]|uniref:antitoxin Xre-like helix-turn-helix domain-containing protein n=1 Tax=Aquisalimonas sp. 2447 TaxID=2740807 RepID=UPI0035304744
MCSSRVLTAVLEEATPSREVGLRDNTIELYWIVRSGFPILAIAALMRETTLEIRDVDRLIVNRRTLRRREKNQRALSVEESERVLRLARTFDDVYSYFDDFNSADSWVRRKSRFLQGVSPLDAATTEIGQKLVSSMLINSRHGFAV